MEIETRIHSSLEKRILEYMRVGESSLVTMKKVF